MEQQPEKTIHLGVKPSTPGNSFGQHSSSQQAAVYQRSDIGSPLPTHHLRHVIVAAKDGRTGQDMQLHYTHEKVIGNGSFGVVYQAKLMHTGEMAAIKKVLQDKRFKVCVWVAMAAAKLSDDFFSYTASVRTENWK